MYFKCLSLSHSGVLDGLGRGHTIKRLAPGINQPLHATADKTCYLSLDQYLVCVCVCVCKPLYLITV